MILKLARLFIQLLSNYKKSSSRYGFLVLYLPYKTVGFGLAKQAPTPQTILQKIVFFGNAYHIPNHLRPPEQKSNNFLCRFKNFLV